MCSLNYIEPANNDKKRVSKVEIVSCKNEESWQVKLVQIVIPFFIAGLGMVGAGCLLSVVQVKICFLMLEFSTR